MRSTRPSRPGQAAGLVQRSVSWLLLGATGGLERLGPVRSSNLGGWLGRRVGPLLPVSRVADRNLRQALPELDAAARRQVIRQVWDNLGRTVAELPHLKDFKRTDSGPGWEVEGEQHLQPYEGTSARALFFSGHLGNWEMMLLIASRLEIHMASIYRAASNSEIDRTLQAIRKEALGERMPMFPKGPQGARAALAHLQRGGSLGLLVDQKMNDGIAVPFFGRDAMTAPAMAQFALRFEAPMLPVHVVRLGPARFRMVCDPPLAVARTGDRLADIRAISCAMNETLERWIRANPSSWLWLHRRWPNPPAAR